MTREASKQEPIRVVVVSDVRLYRDGLVQCLSRQDSIEVVGSSAGGAESLEVVARIEPDIVLLDMSSDGSRSAVPEIAASGAGPRVVAFAVDDIDEVIACAEAGIAGYVARDGAVNEVVEAIEFAHRGELRCSPAVAARAFDRLATLAAGRPSPREEQPRLTAREMEIVELIDQGLSNKQIARRLYITIATVKNHVHNVLEKLHVGRRGEAAAMLRSMRAKARRPRRGSAVADVE